MRRLGHLLGALGVGLLFPASAVAQEQVFQIEELTYQGIIEPGCVMFNVVADSSHNVTLSDVGSGTATVVLGQLTGDDAVSIGAYVTLQMQAVCNQAHSLHIGSQNGALVTTSSRGSVFPFRDRVPYALVASWANGTQSFVSIDGSQSRSVGSAARGPVTVTIQIPVGGSPIVAGSYSDQLVLEFRVAG